MILEKTNIFIEGLRLYAHHGVMAQETVVGHEFVVDIKLSVDSCKAVETDDLCDTVSYADVYELLKAEMLKPSKLIEHVAGRMAQSILNRFPQIVEITISLRKVNPPMGADCTSAGVEIKCRR